MTDALLNLTQHMDDESDIECVGLLLESGKAVRLKNQANSRSRFFVNPSQFVDIHDQIDSPITALYHSHLDKPPVPSDEDKRMMFYLQTVWEDVFHIILSPQGNKAYHVVDDQIVERELPWS